MATTSRTWRTLARRDPALAGIMRGRTPFTPRARPDPYLDLLQSIVSQQLSVKAADTIFKRLCALFPRGYPTADRLAGLSDQALRAAGVSRQKAGYLRNVAEFARAGGLRLARLRAMTDDEVIAHLTAIKGVGRWTVEMLLMFTLGRPDIFPVDDVGIQAAMIRLYRLRVRGPALRRRMEKIAEAWRPHRTAACHFLWQWRDT